MLELLGVLLGFGLGWYVAQRSAAARPKSSSVPKERTSAESVALNAVNLAVLAIDASQTISLVNPAAQKLLGHEHSLVGRLLVECVRAPALQEAAALALAGQGGVAEIDRGSQGKWLAVLTPVVTPRDDTPAIRVVIALTDVTELRRLEVVRRDFVANVSHELKTPVSVIRANAETLLGGALEEAAVARTFVGAILRSAERLSELLAELLDVARLEAGEYKFNLQVVSVDNISKRVIDALQGRADTNKIVLEYAPSRWAVLADSSALEQILVNYVDNAIQHSGAGALVKIGASQLGSSVRISVEDNGPGIESRHHGRLFERFYRVDSGRARSSGGTGLGLAIVKHLAEGMGGSVGVEQVEPHGSRFWVDLPAPPQ